MNGESLNDKSYFTEKGQKEFNFLFNSKKKIFQAPKSYELLAQLCRISVQEYDIVLDFFGGSGTTAQAILELNKDGGNRKFILVQLPEKCAEDSEAFEAGYKTIADIGKERVRRVIKKIEKERTEKPDLFDKSNLDLGFKIFKLSSS